MTWQDEVWEEGDRVIVPDVQKINPFGSPPQPHGPGEVIAVREHKYHTPQRPQPPMLTVRLDSGEECSLNSQFVTREEQP